MTAVLSGANADAQCIIKNAWSDGSAKVAILSGTATLAAGTATALTVSAGSQSGGTPLATSDLPAGLRTSGVSIGCGAFGSVSWSGAEFDAPFAVWISGPRMSSWIYRKAVGTDAHLVAWIELRLYAGGWVEVLPWIENGYLNVAGPTSKSATFTFTLGGTQRVSVAINLPHHCRSPLINGAALSYWLASDPGLVARHDMAYLQRTELVPSYRATVSATAGVVTALPASFTPLQQGSFNYDGDAMTSTGYQEPIGLLPQHDVLYLTSSADVYASVVRNGFSAGRYPIHYRDETTHRPMRFSAYPGLGLPDGSQFQDNGSSSSLTPAVGGTSPVKWDTAHSPSVGFMAYLVTGRWYFMEQVQFAATANHLGKGSDAALRDGAKGLVKPAIDAWQTRAAAWQWRTLAQAAVITPDADAGLRTEFLNAIQHNIDHLHGTYVAQANNPFGFIQSGTTAYGGGTGVLAPWQQDFFTAATGYCLAMKPAVSAAHLSKLASFFAWTAQSVIGRLGPTGGSAYPFVSADPYVLRISNSGGPDFEGGTGPWLASWAAIWSAQTATLALTSSPSAWLTNSGNTLGGEIIPGEASFWGNLLPAISYAVRHGVSGAPAAYSRLTGASNWGALAAAFDSRPVWGVQPPNP